MLVQSFFLLLFFSAVSCNDDCPSDKSNLAPVRLRTNLLCGYDKTTRPVENHKDAIQVFMRMIVKYFNYNIHNNEFTVDSWIAMFWKDQHLKWNPADYESVSTIHFADSDIWMPDISVYNRRDQGGSPAAIDSVTCIVSSSGQVVCVPSTHHSSLCVGDLTKYPFDSHNCTIRLGSWVHSGEELDIRTSTPALSTDDLVPNGEWYIEDTEVIKHPGKFKCCPNNTYPSINFSFKLKRKSGAHIASIIFPATALIITTLTSLWIAPNHPQRLPLCYVNFVSSILYLQYISWILPWNGDKLPLILLFARDALLLTALTIVLSVMLNDLSQNEKPAPEWMSKIVCVLIAFKPGQIAFLSNTPFKELGDKDEDVSAIINGQDGTNKSQIWVLFAKIIDRLFFVIYLVVFVCMFIGFLP